MLPNTFKTSKPLVLKKLFTEYIIKNYGSQSVTEKVDMFINALQQNQNVLCSLIASNAGSSFYQNKKDIILSYINQLNVLHTKMIT